MEERINILQDEASKIHGEYCDTTAHCRDCPLEKSLGSCSLIELNDLIKRLGNSRN
jgi:hypothetical protein